MTILSLTSNAYPVSFYEVRQANPNVSFPASPTDEDLAPFGYVNVTPTPQPSYDQRIERIKEAAPALDADGIYRQQWTICDATPEEIAAYDEANKPAPDWARFKRIALNSDTLNGIIAAAYESAPVAAGALASALLRAESGDVSDFADAWKKITRAVDVPAEVIVGFVGVAQACQLPPDFVTALSPD